MKKLRIKQKTKLKILEVSPFSSGICGVWTRVKAESELLAEKYDVSVFSSNILRGTGEKDIACKEETLNNITIKRFPTFFSFGQNTFFWKYRKQALILKPDIIITHAYRQYYSTIALKIAQELKIPCILVTHAPFLDKKLRNWKLNLAVSFYDNLIGKKILNQYNKIFTITQWEIPYLLQLKVKKEKLVYSPNGIPKEFFKISVKKPRNKIKKILFLGRIAPIKDLEILIRAVSLLKNKNFIVNLVGPAEENYKKELENEITKLNLEKIIKFHPAIFDLRKKINLIDNHDIFILPSKREGMPQALIEAMARKKLVISSTTDGGKEIIQNGKNGFLFDIAHEKQLAELLSFSLDKKNKKIIEKIEQNAYNSVKQFSWNKLIKKTETIINQLVKK